MVALVVLLALTASGVARSVPAPPGEPAGGPVAPGAAASGGGSSSSALADAGENRPLAFEPNEGQTDAQVDYLTRGSGYTLFLAGGDAVFDLTAADAGAEQPTGADNKETASEPGTPAGAVVRMHLVGAAADPSASGVEALGGASNYVEGDDPSEWHTGVPHYAAVRYADVYPGVDAVYRSDDEGQLEYDFHVAPGADPSAITVGFDGVEGLRLGEDGDLLVDTAVGTLRQHAPVAYQPTADGGRQPVDAEFVRRGEGQVGFALGEYDPDAPVVIDPVVVFSTYLGGRRTDEAKAVAADGSGNAYVTGVTQSAEFSTTTGAYDTTCETDGCGDTTDAFVTKLNTNPLDGPSVVYSTYLGGGHNDRANGVAVDADGAAYLTGTTTSEDLPAPGGFDGTCGADDEAACGTNPNGGVAPDAFVAKLSASGSDLVYGTYLGGGEKDLGQSIAVEGGEAYVTGDTESGDFPTKNAYDDTCGADGTTICDDDKFIHEDAFVTKVNPSADGEQSLVYSTFLGGDDETNDRGRGIAVNAAGEAYVTGTTDSDSFPTTDGAYDRSCAPGQQSDASGCDLGAVGSNAFATKLKPSGSELTYSTYLGGTSIDVGRGIAVDGDGSAYLTGMSFSDDFPTDGFTSDCGTACIAFASKLGPDGSALAYSARFGRDAGVLPPPEKGAHGIAVDDSSGRAYVTGHTASESFPTTEDAYDHQLDGPADGFVTALSADGADLAYSTFLGGDENDAGRGVAVDTGGDVYAAGFTESGDYPTMDATQASHGGARDGFVVKLAADPDRPIVYRVTPDSGPTGGGTAVEITGAELGQVTTVRFGDVEADSFEVGPKGKTITVEAPPVGPPRTRPGAVMVTVSDDRGTSPPTSRARYSYYDGIWRAVPGASPRAHHTATRLGDGRVLLAGGHHDGNALDSVEVYDPTADPAVTNAPSMTTSRVRHTATRLSGGGVLVTGGVGPDGQVLDSAEVYTPGEGWSQVGSMGAARAAHTATRLPNGQVLVAGGHDGDKSLASAELYTPGEGWASADALDHDRSKHTATSLADGRVLVVGGIRKNDAGALEIPPAEVYRPDDDTWTAPPSPAGARHFLHTATALGDERVLVAAGATTPGSRAFPKIPPQPTNLAELFDPNAAGDEAWQSTTSLDTARLGHAAAPLPGNRALATGGQQAGEFGSKLGSNLADAETYQPASGDEPAAWLASAPMLAPRGPDGMRFPEPENEPQEETAPHTASLLSADPDRFAADPAVCGARCGEVLVVGGSDDQPAEVYTPAPTVSGMDPTSGGEGTEVTLTGTGFTEGMEVFFGQTPAADVTVDSFDQVTAVAPAGTAGSSVQVTVVRESGLAAAPEQFTYPGGDAGGGAGAGDGTAGDGAGDGEGDATQPGAVDDPDLPPGRVDDLAAEAQSNTEIRLSFSAVGADGDGQGAPAGDYVVTQSREPIDSEAAFEEAFALCGGVCSFGPNAVGDELSLTVTDLDPDTTYHYAVKARDEAGNLSERSDSVSATTSTEVVGDGPATACAEPFVPDAGFGDVDGNVHAPGIACVAWYGITLGMGDLDGDGTIDYGPRQPITREQMASFLARLAVEAGLELPADAPDAFGDDDNSVHESRINALAALGITEGKGDADGDGRPDYAPREPVFRDQMASFLIRLHQRVTGTLPEGGDMFGDDDGSVHEDNIDALATLGVTEGKGDVDGDGRPDYAPREPVFRDQMASFLARHLDELADAGTVHPGGAEVLLEATEAASGGELAGRVRSHRQVTALAADGCGLTGESVSLDAQDGFTLAVPEDQAPGACELTLTATVQPADPAAEGDGQRVGYRFDVTVTE